MSKIKIWVQILVDDQDCNGEEAQEICNQLLDTVNNLDGIAMEVTSGVDDYQEPVCCPECGTTNAVLMGIDGNADRYYCRECEDEFLVFPADDEEEEEEEEDEGSPTCGFCDQKFESWRAAGEHERHCYHNPWPADMEDNSSDYGPVDSDPYDREPLEF